MKQTIIAYGSTTGTCEAIAQTIAQKLGAEAISVAELTAETIAANDNLILGTSTWGLGEVQDDWYDGVERLAAADLTGKTVAIFGCGDSESYADSFCGGMRAIFDACEGANVIGAVDAGGYNFADSEAVVDGQFVGLALDDVNESDQTETRINAWLEAIEPQL